MELSQLGKNDGFLSQLLQDKPITAWSENEIQQWLKQKYPKQAQKFERWNGEDLVALTEDQFRKEFTHEHAIKVYNAIQKWKG